ncbi:MAG TPA: hypothetical protein VKB92_17735 [Myxococcales bacterium]|nr:hypothetical protein [Myxococcales bacterium]
MRAAAAVFLATALAPAARASPPDELFDPLKSIEYDLYDFAPEEQALWEESRWSANSVRLDLGSVTLRELFATQEAQVNLRALPWLGFHLDVQDDRTREAEVSRFAADVLFSIAPGVELAVSGTPDVVKQQSAIGGALVLTSADRTRYAVLRLLDDAAFFNLQNPSGASRDSPVWRAQAEGRWASGSFSAWGRADLGTSSDVRYASAPPQGVQATSDQRSDVDAHLRWAERNLAAGVRVTARRLDSARMEQEQESALRRGFVYARAYLLAPVLPRIALRVVALGWRERARGLDQGAAYGFSRWDLGGRLGGVWRPAEEWTFEAGYARVHSAQDLSGLRLDQWADKAYGTVRWAPRERVRLHFLISHQVSTGHFGGFNGGFEVIF